MNEHAAHHKGLIYFTLTVKVHKTVWLGKKI